jgi:hypothetical protein
LAGRAKHKNRALSFPKHHVLLSQIFHSFPTTTISSPTEDGQQFTKLVEEMADHFLSNQECFLFKALLSMVGLQSWMMTNVKAQHRQDQVEAGKC